MKILETDQGWTVEHNGKSPIAVEGESYFTDKDVLISIIERRDRYVWSDGSVNREPENSSGAPATEDPPTDPNAQPNDPDPNPVSPEPVTTKPKKASGGKVSKDAAQRVSDKLAAHKGDNILRPEQLAAVGGAETIEKLTKSVKAKPRKQTDQKAAEDPEKPRRGRPRKYTPEEAEQRRREKSREYAANRTPEQKAAARERAKRWRENNPDKVKEARQKSMEKRTDRYQNDPEYRQQFNEYQREYKRSKRGDTE